MWETIFPSLLLTLFFFIIISKAFFFEIHFPPSVVFSSVLLVLWHAHWRLIYVSTPFSFLSVSSDASKLIVTFCNELSLSLEQNFPFYLLLHSQFNIYTHIYIYFSGHSLRHFLDEEHGDKVFDPMDDVLIKVTDPNLILETVTSQQIYLAIEKKKNLNS